MRRLSDGSSNDESPNFSRDGRWIYFTSDRTGRREVHRMSVDGRHVEQVTVDGGDSAMDASDGRHIVVARRTGTSRQTALWEVTLATRSARPLPVLTTADALSVVGSLVYFVPWEGPSLAVYDLASGSTKPVPFAPKDCFDFTVSPDGRTIIYTKLESQSDLMMVDNFR